MEHRWKKIFGSRPFQIFGRKRESRARGVVFILMLLFLRIGSVFGSCLDGIGVDGYGLIECKRCPDSTVSIFAVPGRSGKNDAFDFMPFYVAIFKSGIESLLPLAVDGNWASLLDSSLIYKNMIDERSNLNEQATRKLSMPGWSVVGEVFVYHANTSQIGMIVVCARASRNLSGIHVAVYQCSSLYEEDVRNFKRALRYVERQRNRIIVD